MSLSTPAARLRRKKPAHPKMGWPDRENALPRSHMRQQKVIDLRGGGRAALETAGKALRAAADAETAGLPAVILPDADRIVKGQAAIVRLQLVERVQQRPVAGAAGCIRADIPAQRLHATRRPLVCDGRCRFVERGDRRGRKICAADAERLRHRDVGDVLRLISHGPADEAVAEHRILAGEYPVHFDRVAAFLKVQIAADVVDQDEIPVDQRVQMRDRRVQPERVEAALFRVGDQPLRVFQRAGDERLPVALQNRHVDQKSGAHGLVADLDLHALRVIAGRGILLQVDERDPVLPADVQQAACLNGFRGPAADPGALNDAQVAKAVFLQVFQYARHQLRVRRCTAGGGRADHQIRLQRDRGIPAADLVRQPGGLQQLFGHLFIVFSVDQNDLLVLHDSSLPAAWRRPVSCGGW